MKLMALLLIIISIRAARTDNKNYLENYFLIKNKFQYTSGDNIVNLVFQKNNLYYVEFDTEGWSWYNEGNYQIESNRILLYPNKCTDNKQGSIMNCNKSIGKAICKIQVSKESLYYLKYLSCRSLNNKNVIFEKSDTIDFAVINTKLKAGVKRKIDGVDVILMGEINGTTTANVYIREKPSINSESIKFRAGYLSYEPISTVPPNTNVLIIAKTIIKDSVNNYNNYWYYVHVGTHRGVWIYGEFIKM